MGKAAVQQGPCHTMPAPIVMRVVVIALIGGLCCELSMGTGAVADYCLQLLSPAAFSAMTQPTGL
jgi:hypothetical protein